MHGLGNDFVIMHRSPLIDEEFAKKIMNRNIGLGCDQLITYEHISGNRYEVDVWNVDGSKAGGCGNAVRCLAILFNEQTFSTKFEVDILGRINTAEIQGSEVAVNMGTATLNPNWQPSQQEIKNFSKEFDLNHESLICADIGNKHLIIFCTTEKMSNELRKMSDLCEKMSKHKIFPYPVNINIAYVIDRNNIDLSVYELDSGFTYACGTGACVTFLASHSKNLVDNNVKVHFKIGALTIAVDERKALYMKGSATKVADGVYYG